jgi:hypothetical protein
VWVVKLVQPVHLGLWLAGDRVLEVEREQLHEEDRPDVQHAKEQDQAPEERRHGADDHVQHQAQVLEEPQGAHEAEKLHDLEHPEDAQETHVSALPARNAQIPRNLLPQRDGHEASVEDVPGPVLAQEEVKAVHEHLEREFHGVEEHEGRLRVQEVHGIPCPLLICGSPDALEISIGGKPYEDRVDGYRQDAGVLEDRAQDKLRQSASWVRLLHVPETFELPHNP